MKGLIIKDPWITKILNGEKTWEIRGSKTKIRGTVALIKSKTGMIFGTVDIVDCIPLTMYNFSANKEKHHVEYAEIDYKTPYAWVLENPKYHHEIMPYSHPRGAVIWVNL